MDRNLKRAFLGSLVLLLLSITALLFKINDLRAELLMSISGKVIDYDTGKGIPEGKVVISHQGRYFSSKTDKNGNFTIKNLPEGRYEIRIGSILASLPDYYVPHKYPEYIDLKAGKNITDVKIFVKRGATVSGKILSDDGKTPIKGAMVYIKSKETDFYNETRREDFSDENGIYRIEGIIEGYSFDIVVERVYGYADERKINLRIKDKKELNNIDIIMGKRSKIVVTGKILSSKNKAPVVGAQIFFMKNQLPEIDSGWGLTNSKGEFHIKGLTSGNYDIAITPGPEELMKYEAKTIKGFYISEDKRNYIKVFLEPIGKEEKEPKKEPSFMSKLLKGISETLSQIFRVRGKHFEVIAEWGKEGDREGEFVRLKDVCVDDQGYVYTLEGGGRIIRGKHLVTFRVQKFSGDGKFIKSWGRRGMADGEFNAPVAITVDRKNTIYVLEESIPTRIQKFDSEGNFILKWGKMQADKDYYASKVTPGEFYIPQGITSDWEGNIYVWDSNAIQKFDSNGKFISVLWGPELRQQMGYIVEIIFDKEGNYYMLDLYEQSHWHMFIRVQKFNPEGKRIAQILEKQKVHLNFPPDPLRPTEPEFYPGSLAVDSKGNIYVQKSSMKETWLMKYSLVKGEYKLQWKEKIYGGIKVDRHDNFYFISSKRIQKVRIKD